MPPQDPPDETPRPPALDTPAEIAAERERCEAKAEWHRSQVELHRLMAESFEAQVAMLRRREALARGGLAPTPLRSVPRANILDAMNASPESNSLRSKAAFKKGSSRHAWVAAFAAKGETLAIACDRVGAEVGRKIPKTTAQGWYKKPSEPGYRPIPHDCFLAIQKLWGVPRGAWHRVTGEP